MIPLGKPLSERQMAAMAENAHRIQEVESEVLLTWVGDLQLGAGGFYCGF